MRYTLPRRPRNPFACSRTFLCRALAVTPRLTLGMVCSRYANGIIAQTESMLVLWISVEPRRWRFDFVVFLVRMWRLNACERLIEPLPRTRKRFFAPDLVFIFGIAVLSLFAALGGALRRFLGRGFGGLVRTVLGLVGGMLRCDRLGYDGLLRGQQHHHLPAFESRERLDDAVRLEIAPDSFEQTHTEFLVRHLAAAKAQRDLRLVAFRKKSYEVA